MKKAIDLSVHIHIGSAPDAADHVGPALVAAFAAANPGLQLKVKSMSAPNAQGDSIARVRIEGEQEAAADFAQFAGDALHRAVAQLNGPPARQAALVGGGSSSQVALQQVVETGDEGADDENSGVFLPPGHTIAGEQAAIAARAAASASAATPDSAPAGPAPATDEPAATPSHDSPATLATVTPTHAEATPPSAPANPTAAVVTPPGPSTRQTGYGGTRSSCGCRTCPGVTSSQKHLHPTIPLLLRQL